MVYAHRFDLLPSCDRLLQLKILSLVFIRGPPAMGGFVALGRASWFVVISPLGNSII